MNSDELYKKMKELEKEVLKVQFIKKEDSVGKIVKNIVETSLSFYNGYRPIILIMFTDSTALYYEDGSLMREPFFYNSFESSGKGSAYLTDLGWWFKVIGILNDPTDLLYTAIKWQESMYTKRIKEDIQRKLDDISKLKELL